VQKITQQSQKQKGQQMMTVPSSLSDRKVRALDWLEERHWDVLFVSTLQMPRWVVGNCDNDDEIAEGATPPEAIEKAMEREK
jgi:hypothetical protein